MKSAAGRYGLLAIGIAGLSLAGVFYKLAAAPVIAVVAWRMLIGALVMAPLTLVLTPPRARRAPFERADLVRSVAAGLFFSADLMLWALSLRYTSIASAALFVSTQPIFVAVFAATLLRERPSAATLGGVALGIAGIAVVGFTDVRVSGTALIGDGLAMSAALAETAYLLLGRHVRQRIDAPRYVLVVYATCAVCCWLVLASLRVSPHLSTYDLALAAGVALSATVIGHTLVSLSLGYMPAAVVAVSFLAQPMLAALFALAFVHQPIPMTTVVGGMIALAGIGIVAYANERSTPAISTTAT